MFKRGYTYIEVIVALAVLLLTVVPVVKLSNLHLISYNKMEDAEEDIEFFNFIETTFHAIDYEKLENKIGNYSVNNFENFKILNIFTDKISMDKNKFENRKYSMDIKIEEIKIDYVNRTENGIFVVVNLRSKDIKSTRKILRMR